MLAPSTLARSPLASRTIAALLLALTPLAGARAQRLGDLPGGPRDPGVALADSLIGEALMEGAVQRLRGREIDVVLVAGEKATAGDCLGVEVRAGAFQLRFGDSTFQIGGGGVDLELAIDRIELTGIKIRTKTPVTACQWTDTFEVGGAISDIRLRLRIAPRIDMDDCVLSTLGGVEASVSIGNLNLKPLQNDIDALLVDLFEDAINAALEVFSLDPLADALNGTILEDLCNTKLILYKAYMHLMFGQVDLHPFPAELASKLASHFPTVDLGDVRFGYRWQPARNNTTDCSNVYFSDPDLVDRLSYGLDLSGDEWNLLFHELQHTEQCARLGGRDAYAKRWFRDLEYAALVTNLSDPLSYVLALHDNMPLEEDASARSNEVVAVQGMVLDAASGAGVPDILVSAIEAPAPGSPPGSTVASGRSVEAQVRPRAAAGRYRLFLEPGVYDLYVAESVRGVASRGRHLAVSGVQIVAGDLAHHIDVRLDADSEPVPPPAAPATFRRGDANASGEINIADPLYTLGWLFTAGDPPACEKAADTNDDGDVDLSDALATLGFLFLGANAPPAPFPACGSDPTPDALECAAPSTCG